MDLVLFFMLSVVIVLLLSNPDNTLILSRVTRLNKRRIILDSCALIDGRIVDLVRTGFISDELIVPKFILNELQLLADGKDAHKRERARFGLEIAAELQEYAWANVKIDETKFPGSTDEKLIKLAKKIHGVLCTTDYNLNKVAAVESIRTLNVNELSQALRPVALPGEKMEVKIIQKGSNGDQGVGYLEDGTMIVVDGAAKSVGNKVSVTVDRMHQSVAGKMVFAHKHGNATQPVLKQAVRKRPAPTQSGPRAITIRRKKPAISIKRIQ